jgi:gamma-glutamylcysteine synthetase
VQDGSAGSAQEVLAKLAESGAFCGKQELDASNNMMLVALQGEKYDLSAEVGVGTIEVISQPVENLFQLQENHILALNELGRAVEETGQHLLGFGVQPLTPMSEEILTLKHRYKLMHKLLGSHWLSFTVTASEQAHVDIVTKEVVQTINITNLLSAVYTALFANSSVVAGDLAGVVSARELLMGRIEQQWRRHGMPLRPVQSIEDWIDYLSEMTFYMAVDTTTGESHVPSLGPVPFKEYMSQLPPNWAEFVNHDHYVWHSCRARFKQSTVEFRAACQQPFQDQMVVPALSLGIVQSMQDVERWLVGQRPITEWWHVLSQVHQHAIQHGLQNAEQVEIKGSGVRQNDVVEQIDFAAFTHRILQFAEAGLVSRGLGEEVFLKPLYRRLKYGASPGQEAAEVFKRGGMPALLQATAQPYAQSATNAAVAAGAQAIATA